MILSSLSEDENTLEVFEDGNAKGVYKAEKAFEPCIGCFFCSYRDCDFDSQKLGERRCGPNARKDKKGVIWIKQEPKATPHIHANLIKVWAEDIGQTFWVWSSVVNDWLPTVPSWDVKCFYAIGEKPITPPTLKTTVKISLDTTELTIELPIGSRKEEIEKAIMDQAVQFISHDYEFDK